MVISLACFLVHLEDTGRLTDVTCSRCPAGAHAETEGAALPRPCAAWVVFSPESSRTAKNHSAPKARSGSTSMPGLSRGSSRRARAVSSRSVAEPSGSPSSSAGSGLGQGHHPKGGQTQPIADLADLRPDTVGLRDLHRVAASPTGGSAVCWQGPPNKPLRPGEYLLRRPAYIPRPAACGGF